MLKQAKKLVAVSATSTSMTDKKMEEELEWISCIRYLVTFKSQTKTLLDWENKVNAMSQPFVQQLDLKIYKTNVRALKINGITLETYGMVVSTFSVSDKDRKEKFFEESFLLVDIKPDIVFGMLFLTMNNTDINFQARDL